MKVASRVQSLLLRRPSLVRGERCLNTGADKGHSMQESKTQESSPTISKRVPLRDDFSIDACNKRRAWAENFTGVPLPAMGNWLDDEDTRSFKGNIELPMGTVKTPVAPVGPLMVNGEYAKGEFVCPFATTEGALTASVMRGVNAINAGSGVTAWTGVQQSSRGPFFVTRHPEEAMTLGNWIRKQIPRIQDEVVRKVSQRAVLTSILPLYDMECVHLVFNFTTGDACGQNMATSCTWAAMQWLQHVVKNELPNVHIDHAFIEGNSTSDKKPGAISMLLTRGMATQVKAILPEEVLNKKLRVRSADMHVFTRFLRRMSHRNLVAGSALQANSGNVLAAVFLALGQDLACVAESITGNEFEIQPHFGEGGGIEASLTFPSLMVGSVGGGTSLPTQREGLEMIGCYGPGKVRKLAEIVASFCLALDISTASAMTAGDFATGHDKLGRNRPEDKA